MNSRNTIQDELRSLNSELSSDLNKTLYTVPQGYFEGLADAVLTRIKTQNASASEEIAELSPLLAGLSKKMPFSVPDDYFRASINDLPLIASEDEESAMLSYIGKEMPYEVPSDYFQTLPEKILLKVSEKKGKVVSFGRTRFVRMMAAAAIIGLIAISGIFYFRNTGGGSTQDVAVVIKKASTEELNAFIKSTDASAIDEKSPVTAKNSSSNKEAKKIFQDVSDEELQAFLDQVPIDDEELMD